MLINRDLYPIFFVAMCYFNVYRYTIINRFTIIGHIVSIFFVIVAVMVIVINNAAKDITMHIFFCTCPIVSLG